MLFVLVVLFINVIVNVNGIIIINVLVSFSCYFHISVSYQGHVNVNVIFYCQYYFVIANVVIMLVLLINVYANVYVLFILLVSSLY